jgi:hypothetical protein
MDSSSFEILIRTYKPSVCQSLFDIESKSIDIKLNLEKEQKEKKN